MRAHPRSLLGRMRPYPMSTEVETVLLFLYQVVAPVAWIPYVLLGAVVFNALSALDRVRRSIGFRLQKPADIANGGQQAALVR